MAKPRYLKNAPIDEALIDIRVQSPPDFKISAFNDLKDKLATDYPHVKERKLIKGKFGFSKDKVLEPTIEDIGITGLIFKSEDGLNIAQFRIDGFTYNRLKPYTTWELVVNEAQKLWDLYLIYNTPLSIPRIATRFINRINLPLPFDLKRYFTAPPSVPATLNLETQQFLVNMRVRESGSEVLANITQSLEKRAESGYVSILLDIDTYILKEEGFDNKDIWLCFEKLREFKNRLFFESIQEETAEMYE